MKASLIFVIICGAILFDIVTAVDETETTSVPEVVTTGEITTVAAVETTVAVLETTTLAPEVETKAATTTPVPLTTQPITTPAQAEVTTNLPAADSTVESNGAQSSSEAPTSQVTPSSSQPTESQATTQAETTTTQTTTKTKSSDTTSKDTSKDTPLPRPTTLAPETTTSSSKSLVFNFSFLSATIFILLTV